MDRVWKALGISTFLDAKGIAIDEHVARALATAKANAEEAARMKRALERISVIANKRDGGTAYLIALCGAEADSALAEGRK